MRFGAFETSMLAAKVPPMSTFGVPGVNDTIAGETAFTGISGIASRNVAISTVARVSILFFTCNASGTEFCGSQYKSCLINGATYTCSDRRKALSTRGTLHRTTWTATHHLL